MRHRASAPDFSSVAEAAAGCWLCSKMLLLFFSRCKKQTPSTGVCSQQDSVLYAFEHLQYSISGFAPKEQNCANVVSMLWRVFHCLRPQQVTGKLNSFAIWMVCSCFRPTSCVFCTQNISNRFFKQIASKLTHAQIGMYFMYLGAVVGSSGLMSSDATASLISRDTVPDAESFNPNRSRRELFVNCSPCTCLIQACK